MWMNHTVVIWLPFTWSLPSDLLCPGSDHPALIVSAIAASQESFTLPWQAVQLTFIRANWLFR
jgi:hypothetical protein